MSNLDSVLTQLKQEREALSKAITALEGVSQNGTRTKRTMSASARKRIGATQRARWAKWKRAHKKGALSTDAYLRCVVNAVGSLVFVPTVE